MSFVGSDLALRFYRLSEHMGVPLPIFSDDEVVNFMVQEAVMARGLRSKKEQADAAAPRDWKRGAPGSGGVPFAK